LRARYNGKQKNFQFSIFNFQ